MREALVQVTQPSPLGSFAVVPRALLDDPAVQATDLLVYMALARHVNAERVAWPSLRRIGEVARLSKAAVCRGLKRLEAGGWLRRGAGGKRTTEYQILLESRDPSAAMCLPERQSKCLPGRHEVDLAFEVDSAVPDGTAGRGPAKGPLETPSTLLAEYHALFLAKFKTKPVIQGAKDVVLLKRLMGSHGAARVRELLGRFFETDDKFIQASGYTLGVFHSQFNKLIVEAAPARRRYRLPEGPNYENDPRDSTPRRAPGDDRV